MELNDYRLAPAGSINDVVVEVLKYEIFGDGTVGGRNIPERPEPASPVALADRGKFPLHPIRRTALLFAHQIEDGELRRLRYELIRTGLSSSRLYAITNPLPSQ